jgi:hypothetical protein
MAELESDKTQQSSLPAAAATSMPTAVSPAIPAAPPTQTPNLASLATAAAPVGEKVSPPQAVAAPATQTLGSEMQEFWRQQGFNMAAPSEISTASANTPNLSQPGVPTLNLGSVVPPGVRTSQFDEVALAGKG